MLWWTSEEQADRMEASSKDAQSTEADVWGLSSPAMRKKGSTPGEIVPAAILPAVPKLFQSHAGYFQRWSRRVLL